MREVDFELTASRVARPKPVRILAINCPPTNVLRLQKDTELNGDGFCVESKVLPSKERLTHGMGRECKVNAAVLCL